MKTFIAVCIVLIMLSNGNAPVANAAPVADRPITTNDPVSYTLISPLIFRIHAPRIF